MAGKDYDWVVEAALWRRLFSFICQDAYYGEQAGEIGELRKLEDKTKCKTYFGGSRGTLCWKRRGLYFC